MRKIKSLRAKTLVMIAVTLALTLSVLAYAAQYIVLDSFKRLEAEDANGHVLRVRHAIEENIHDLERNLLDYAYWNDAYDYIIDRNEKFIEDNFINDTFATNRWNVALLIDKSGKIVYAKAFDLEKKSFDSMPKSWEGEIFRDLEKFSPKEKDGFVSGLLWLDESPLLVGSRYILPSKLDGEARGIMVAGRFLNEAEIARTAKSLGIDLSGFLWNSPSSDAIKGKFKRGFKKPLLRIMDNDHIEAFSVLKDLQDRPLLVLRIELERKIFARGKQSLFYMLSAVLFTGLLFGFAIIALLEKLVLKRVYRLAGQVQALGESGGFTGRVTFEGEDEIATLSHQINQMLGSHEMINKLLEEEQRKSENLLLDMLPPLVADRLKANRGSIAESYSDASILFADIVGFTELSSKISPEEVVRMLNTVFSDFDRLAEKHGLEKIKTIGDAYMLVGGLPNPREDHVISMANMALEMLECLNRLNRGQKHPIRIRIGINVGPVVAGVIGTKKFLYDIWGDAVNTASRMESSGQTGMIHITEDTYLRLQGHFVMTPREAIEIKGKGSMQTYFLEATIEQQRAAG